MALLSLAGHDRVSSPFSLSFPRLYTYHRLKLAGQLASFGRPFLLLYITDRRLLRRTTVQPVPEPDTAWYDAIWSGTESSYDGGRQGKAGHGMDGDVDHCIVYVACDSSHLVMPLEFFHWGTIYANVIAP